MVQKTRASGLIMQFDLRVTGFEWPVSQSNNNEETTDMLCLSGDSFPLCTRILGWTRSDEESFFNVEYQPGGIRVRYQPYALEGANFQVPDTLKLGFFSTHPKIMTTECKSNPAFISTYRGKEALYAPIATGYVAIERLKECMRDDKTSLNLSFSHNFNASTLHVSLQNAEVTVEGVKHLQGDRWVRPMKQRISSVSLLHTMEDRSMIIQQNCSAFGDAALTCTTVREHSIGAMMGCAMTALPMMGEALPLSLLADYFRSDTAAICPEYAAHFAVHAHALLGMCAEVDKLTPVDNCPMTSMYKAPRKMEPLAMLRLIHTTLTVPQLCNEMAPYVSDVVACPGALLTQQLLKDDTEGRVLSRADFVATECVDTPFCAPNDYFTQGNDCEGHTARLMQRLACLRAAVDPALAALQAATKDFATGSASGEALSQFIDEGCHAELPQDAHFAYAAQIFALGYIAREAVELCGMTVGAHCATPLQRTQTDAVVEEGGHSCATMKIDKDRCASVYTQAHSYCMSLLRGDAVKTFSLDKKSITPLRILHNDGSEGAPYTALYNMGSSSMPAYSQRALPLCDVTSSNCEFWLVESTSPVSPCPITGNLSVNTSRLTVSDALQAQKQSSEKLSTVQLPLAEMLQTSELMNVEQYMSDDHANVRCTGYVNPRSLHRNTDFYNTFYTLDGYMLNQLYDQKDGNPKYFAGVDAMDFLFNAKSSKMTIEKIRMPLMSNHAENSANHDDEKTMLDELRAQWKETRMPSIGSAAVLKLTRNMQRATGAKFHCPENMEKGLRRCNIVLSGAAAMRFLADHNNDTNMQKALCKQTPAAEGDVLLASEVFRIGAESVALSHTVDTVAFARKLGTPVRENST